MIRIRISSVVMGPVRGQTTDCYPWLRSTRICSHGTAAMPRLRCDAATLRHAHPAMPWHTL